MNDTLNTLATLTETFKEPVTNVCKYCAIGYTVIKIGSIAKEFVKYYEEHKEAVDKAVDVVTSLADIAHDVLNE